MDYGDDDLFAYDSLDNLLRWLRRGWRFPPALTPGPSPAGSRVVGKTVSCR
jgi:hypothetical protein